MKKVIYGVGIDVSENIAFVTDLLSSLTNITGLTFFLSCPQQSSQHLYQLLSEKLPFRVFKPESKATEITEGIYINSNPGNLFEALGRNFRERAIAIVLNYNNKETIKALIPLKRSGGLVILSNTILSKRLTVREKEEIYKLSDLIPSPIELETVINNLSEHRKHLRPSKTYSSISSPPDLSKEPGSVIVNQAMEIQHYSDELSQYFLYSKNLINSKITTLDPKFSLGIWQTILEILPWVLQTSKSIQKVFQDGELSFFAIINSLTGAGKLDNCAVITFIDNSNNISILTDLERSETRFKLFFEKAPVGKTLMSPEGRFIRVNESFAHMLGYTKEELINISYRKITHPEDIKESDDCISDLLCGNKKEMRFQKRYLGKDGNIIWADISSRLFYSSDNNPLYFLTHIVDISKRIEAEKARELQHGKTLTMFDAINEIVYVSDPDTFELVYTNESFNRILGVNKTPIGKKCYDVIQGKSEPCDFCTNSIIFDEKPNETHVWEFQNPIAGMWFRCADKAIDWIDGRKLRMELAIDITKEVEYRKNLEFSRERYALASAASNNGIWDWWTDSEEVFYSDQWKAQIGYKPDELENTFSTWENNLHPDDRKRMVRSVMQFLEKPKNYFVEEFRMTHKDGSSRWIHNRAAAVLDDNGKVIRMFGAHSDITDLKMAEEELRKTDLMYRGIIENAPDGVVMLTPENRFGFISNSALRMFDYDKESVLKTDPSELTHPDDLPKVIDLIQNLKNITPVTPPTLEYRFKHANGTWRWIESTFSISKNEDGNPAIVINFRDIQERKEYEHQLVEAKKKAESANIHKNYFLANMSHEIRTPMNGVIGFSELLKDDSITGDQRDKYLEIIDSNAKQLLSLIDDIIDVAKIESNELKIHIESCNLIDLMNDILSTFREIKKQKNKDNIELRLHIPENISQFNIKVDCNRLVQVFYNLIGNSIKFSENGVIDFGFDINKNRVNFFVKDQGIGIPEDKLEEIFDRFKQLNYENVAKYGGTGLGLSICRGIVNLFGGEIKVESMVGKGTHFQFHIPYKKTDAEVITQPDLDENVFDKVLQNKTVLLVEDDDFVGLYFQEIFKSTGSKLIWAKNGLEGIKLFRENKDIALVLMDIRMPEMNGYKATQEILRINPKAKIIAQTAYAMQDEKEKCFAAGCIDYLAKPIVKSELEKRISHWIS